MIPGTYWNQSGILVRKSPLRDPVAWCVACFIETAMIIRALGAGALPEARVESVQPVSRLVG